MFTNVLQFSILVALLKFFVFFFFQAEDGIRDVAVTGVQTCALPICRREVRGHDDLHLDELVAGPAAFHARHPVPGQPERAAAGGAGWDLHRDLAAQGRHFHGGAERRLRRRDGKLEVEVVAPALEERVPGHGHDQVEVTTPARRPAALAGYAHALARADAGGDLDVELAARALPAAALAGRAGLAADVARALTGGAGLVHLERQRLACPLERLVEGDLHGGLDVLARSAGAAGAESAEEILGVAAAACPVAHPDTEIPENRPEEVGEVAEGAPVTAVLHTEAAGAGTGRALGVAVPVGSQAVVPPALLGVGENLVRLVDLLEALAAVLALGHVGVVFPGESPVGGLDRLVVRVPVDAENLVVVLEFH